MKNLVDIKPGDRLRYSSPIWKEVIIERMEGGFKCIKAEREQFVSAHYFDNWQEGKLYPSSGIKYYLFEKISKSKNFGTLYDKLCNEE